jgi:CSLREA domain-containing protein
MFQFKRSARSKGDTNQNSFTRILSKALHLVFVAALVAGLALSVAPVPVAHAATITVTTTADELNSDGDCSLREAIQAANTDTAIDACTAGSAADTIVVPAGIYTLGIAGAGENANATGDLDITDDLTINGSGANSTVIDGAGLDRVFEVYTMVGTVAVSGLTIQNGSENGGSGIRNAGTLAIVDSMISNNDTAAGKSGGIYNGGTIVIESSTISNNTGGGIYNGGTIVIESSTISNNDGGAINNEGTLTLIDSLMSGNTNTAVGGPGTAAGIFSCGTLTVEGSTFSHNNNAGNGAGGITNVKCGGPINFVTGTLEVTGSSFRNNTGGGIMNRGTATIEDTTFLHNSGGGVFNGCGAPLGGDMTLTGVTVRGNTDRGIENCGGTLTITNSTITQNTGGSGIVNRDNGTLILHGTQVSRNTTRGDGGGIFNDLGTVTLEGSTVRLNTASRGGGIFNRDSLTLIDSAVTQNTATSGLGSGGGIFNDGGTVSITNSTVRRNNPDDCVGC